MKKICNKFIFAPKALSFGVWYWGMNVLCEWNEYNNGFELSTFRALLLSEWRWCTDLFPGQCQSSISTGTALRSSPCTPQALILAGKVLHRSHSTLQAQIPVWWARLELPSGEGSIRVCWGHITVSRTNCHKVFVVITLYSFTRVLLLPCWKAFKSKVRHPLINISSAIVSLELSSCSSWEFPSLVFLKPVDPLVHCLPLHDCPSNISTKFLVR